MPEITMLVVGLVHSGRERTTNHQVREELLQFGETAWAKSA